MSATHTGDFTQREGGRGQTRFLVYSGEEVVARKRGRNYFFVFARRRFPKGRIGVASFFSLSARVPLTVSW
jgi:hypothetical protein